MLTVTSGVRSDVGLVRANSKDSLPVAATTSP